MEVSLRKSTYPCYQPSYTQTFLLSEGQECVVPDTLPAVASVICTSAIPLIRSKDVSDGRVRIEANVPARVTSKGEDGRIFPIDVNIPFYLSAQDEQISGESVCTALLTLRQVETRMLNPRKLSVRAELAVTVTCYTQSVLTTYLAPEEDASEIHALEQRANTDCVVCATEKTFVLTDEAELPETMPPAEEILAQSAIVSVGEVRAVGSKIIVNGSVNSALLYRCASGALHEFKFRTTFSQIIESDCEAEDASVSLSVLLSGVYYEILPGSEMRTFAMELHLVAQAVISKAQEIAFLTDAYSNRFPLETQSETLCLTANRNESVLEESGKALLETAAEVSEIVSCRAEPIGIETENADALVRLRITLCYRSGEEYAAAERCVTQKIALPVEEGVAVRVEGASVTEIGAVPVPGGAEARYTVAVRAVFFSRREEQCIRSICYDEAQSIDNGDQPTIVMMRVNSRQSLWELAKEHCSTVEAIRSANALDDAAGEWERLLIIPKAQ